MIVILYSPCAGEDKVVDALREMGLYVSQRRWRERNEQLVGSGWRIKRPGGLPWKHAKYYRRMAHADACADAKTAFVLPLIQDFFDGRVVVVQRKREEQAEALADVAGQDLEWAEAKLDDWEAGIEWALEQFNGPVLYVNSEDVQTGELAEFVGVEAPTGGCDDSDTVSDDNAGTDGGDRPAEPGESGDGMRELGTELGWDELYQASKRGAEPD